MSTIHSIGIGGAIVTPSSDRYDESISRISATSVLRPSYVVYPAAESDITLALEYARSQSPPLPVAVKGGGCHTSTVSSSEGGMVIDLSALKSVTVSSDRSTVAVGGGAVWGDVYSELAKHDLVVVGGSVWFVGVGGYTTNAGWSNLSGHYGLAIDNLVGATVVLANGTVVKTSDTQEPDLFWATRGGTNQFGIVTEFVFKTHPARGPALVGVLAYPGTEIQNVLGALREHLRTHNPDSKLILSFIRSPPHFYPGIAILPYIEGDAQSSSTVLAPFRSDTLKPIFEQTGLAPDYNAVSHGADASLAGAPPRHITGTVLFSDLWEDLVLRVFGEWVAFTEHEDRKAGMVLWEFGHRDKIAEVKSDVTAFVSREPHYYVAFTGRHSLPESDTPTLDFVARMTKLVQDTNVEKTGVRLLTPPGFVLAPGTVSAEDVYGSNLPRLRKLKAKYDPKKVWSRSLVDIEPDFGV
ncbi:FAD-binding domain-containing protein [Lyophyllum atratum]|nr:FAD-binding domain-containing protein [Lyophyllum atratum]